MTAALLQPARGATKHATLPADAESNPYRLELCPRPSIPTVSLTILTSIFVIVIFPFHPRVIMRAPV